MKKNTIVKPSTITIDSGSFNKLKYSLGIIIGVFAFVLYIQSISFSYTVDDPFVLKENSLTQQGIKAIPMILKSDYWFGVIDKSLRGPVYRPVPLILFATIWQFFPDNPMVFHLINVLLYSLSCWLLFILLCKLFENRNLVFPFVCTLLYTSHPIHTEVVDNIKSADEILCFLFEICSIFYVLKYYSSDNKQDLIFGGIFFFLSLLSKETGITFLIVTPMVLYFFRNFDKKKLITVSLVLAGISVFYFIIRYEVLKGLEVKETFAFMNTTFYMAHDFFNKEATAFYILIRYLILLILPHPLSYDYSYNEIPIQTLSSLPSIASILVYFSIGIYALINFKRKDIVSFSILFYLITLSAVSNVFISIGATMAERFLYIPSLGFCLVLTFLIIKFTKTPNAKFDNLKTFTKVNSSVLFVTIIISGFYSIKTFSRSMDWKNNEKLYGHDVQDIDNSANAHNLWGHILLENASKEKDSAIKNNNLDKAITELKKAINIVTIFDSYRDLAHCYIMKKDYETSIKYYQIVLQIDKDADTSDIKNLADAFYNLGLLKNQTQQFNKSIVIFDSAIKYKPNFSEAYNNKGVAYLESGKYMEAIEACEKAVAIDPKNHNAYTNIGCAYTNLKQYEKALEYLNKSIAIDSTDYYPVYIMGVTYQLMGDKIKAQQYLDKANKINGAQQK